MSTHANPPGSGTISNVDGAAPDDVVGPLDVSASFRVAAQACDAKVFHLRTNAGEHEIDLVVQGPDGQVLGIEVKLAHSVSDADVRHLLWLREQIPDRIADLVIVTTGTTAYRRRDGVPVIPLALLGP